MRDRHDDRPSPQLEVQAVEVDRAQRVAQAAGDVVAEGVEIAAPLPDIRFAPGDSCCVQRAVPAGLEFEPRSQAAIRRPQLERIIANVGEVPLDDDIEARFEEVGVERDQPPGIDEARAGVGPVAAVRLRDLNRHVGFEVDRDQADRLGASTGLNQRQFENVGRKFAEQIGEWLRLSPHAEAQFFAGQAGGRGDQFVDGDLQPRHSAS